MKLTQKDFLTVADSGIGLILRTGATQENIIVNSIEDRLAFLKATVIPEDIVYDTGHFIGFIDNLILISIRPVVLQFEDNITTVEFSANKEPVGPIFLRRLSNNKEVSEHDFGHAHAGLYHLLLEAALNARGHSRTHPVRRKATADGVCISYPATA